MYWDVALRSTGLWLILSLAAGQLTEQQKSTIVDLHNQLRSQVEPSAAFMQKVVWDESLCVVAEGYATKCIMENNPDLDDLKLGENLFVSTGSFHVNNALMTWFEEKSCAENKMCGPYTQMVWADSNRIGCATHLCDTLEGLSFKNATLLICNYFPKGNLDGEKPYEHGEPCSKCPEDLPECEDNICVSDDEAQLTTERTSVPRESTLTHDTIEQTDTERAMENHGSKMESFTSHLLMLIGLAALVW